MKNVLLQSKIIKVLFVCLFLSNYDAFAQKTTIWVVRHGEKEPATVKTADDPNLSADGQARAEALAKFLKREKIKAVYVTKYKRSIETARPIATQTGLTPAVYGDSLKTFAANVLKTHNGGNVLIVGHSNTVMKILDAFGAEMPFDALDEDDFDMAFKITIKSSGKRELEVRYYGILHHKSDLPQKYQDDDRPAQQFVSPAAHY
jgi:2,3-bisphosphoglycerate-dependent phosphoglycerate mutase